MSGKKNSGLIVFFVLVFVLAFVCLLAFVMYKSQSFPQFNQMVNSVLSDKELVQEQEDIVVPEADFQLEISPAFESVLNKSPLLLEKNTAEIDELRESSADIGGEFVSQPDSFTLSSVNPEWTFVWTRPIVSKPGVFADALVFIDTKPSLVFVERNTGVLLKELPCGVFPAEKAFVNASSYFFQSRSGSWYELSFEDNAGAELASLEPVPIERNRLLDSGNLLKDHVLPSEAARKSIYEKMNSFFSFPEVKDPDGFRLYSEAFGAFPFEHNVLSPVFVFSPKEQGSYVLGLCDKDGNWIRSNSFVTLFSRTGETRAVSLDYVADRPQITIHLSDAELYYVCAGFMDADAAGQAFFQVKKAP